MQPIAEELWTIDDEVSLPGGVRLPVRSVVIRLPEGLWVHAPVQLDEARSAALEALGPVRWLVAPNNVHHLFLPAAAARFPDAQVWTAPGVPRKQPGVRVDGVLGRDAPPWSAHLDQVSVRGAPQLDETVFLHLRSHTLICADLLFHVHEAPPLTRCLLRLMGTWRRFAQSRAWRLVVTDRRAAAEDARRILAWQVERVVPAHGRVLDVDAQDATARALAWLAAGPGGSPSPG